jgi:hypothetical protein
MIPFSVLISAYKPSESCAACAEAQSTDKNAIATAGKVLITVTSDLALRATE